jgi:hypothetical protein
MPRPLSRRHFVGTSVLAGLASAGGVRGGPEVPAGLAAWSRNWEVRVTERGGRLHGSLAAGDGRVPDAVGELAPLADTPVMARGSELTCTVAGRPLSVELVVAG